MGENKHLFKSFMRNKLFQIKELKHLKIVKNFSIIKIEVFNE